MRNTVHNDMGLINKLRHILKNRTLCILQCSMKEKSGLKNRYDKKYVFNFGFSVLISKENFPSLKRF